jgi:methylthioribose-1-phosphate isomerase
MPCAFEVTAAALIDAILAEYHATQPARESAVGS